MGKKLLIIAVAILIGIGLLVVSTGSIYKWKKLPSSLDQYYTNAPPMPPEYLIKMFDLGDSMQGIVVNIQQGDMENASRYFRTFSQQYEDSSRMVPEWRSYYKPKAVRDLGEALDAASLDPSKIPGVFGAIEEVGKTCHKCHIENMPPVWSRYNWKDFSTVTIDTPEGKLPWAEAKMKYVDVGLVGIFVNAKQNNQTGAKQSFSLFKMMFDNMSDACSSCHSSERKYYVSEDIRSMINEAGKKIDSGNLTEAAGIIQGVGMESCYRCHVIHVPAQSAKESQR